MANNPNKVEESVESALSAIDEALNRRNDEQTAPTITVEPRPTRPTPASDSDLFRTLSTDAKKDIPAHRPANDDRETIGDILRAMQPASSRPPYLIATACSAAWVLGCAVFAFAYSPELRAVLTASPLTSPAFYGLIAVLLAPVAFFYSTARMIVRSRELHAVAQSMAQVAIRLAEPESAARDSIVTVGQAIRREVSAMGDGVERALARAAELETLVQNEVSAIERSYNNNEVRIRGLLEDLARQRDILIGQAEQVRSALSGAHTDLNHDINQVSEIVAGKVDEAAQRITRALAEKGENITHALSRVGDSMIDSINERGNNMLDRLEHTGAQTTHAISEASDRLTSSLNFKTDHIGEEFAELSSNLSRMMVTNLDNVAEGFAQKSTAVVEMMGARSRELTESIVDTSSQLAEIISVRAEEVNNTLKATGESLVLDLSLRGGDVVSKLEQTGARVTDSIVTRGEKVSDGFRENAEMLADSVTASGGAVKDLLAARLQAFEEMFAKGGAELAEKIGHDSTTLGNLINRHLGEFDRTVKTYGGELVERLGERTQDITDTMRTYVDNFDNRVTAKTGEVADTLDQRLARFQEALDNRTQTLNDQLSTRVMDIARTIGEGGKEVVSALDKRINDVTGTINARSAKLVETIDLKAAEIDNTLGLRAMEVANNLDSRIGRFEELLVGRAQEVTSQIEVRTRAAADALNARMEQLAEAIRTNAGDAERALTALSQGVSGQLQSSADDVERKLLGVSDQVARNFVGKADEISTAVNQRAEEMTRILDTSSSTLLSALSDKSRDFTGQINRATEEAVHSIGAHGFEFTNTMLNNSHELSRMINQAGESASEKVNATLKSLEEQLKTAIEQSRESASAAVTEISQTQATLRSDATSLFDRLREANILLQEVLTGTHENMRELENTMVTRVGEFVATMKDITERSGIATDQVSTHINAFNSATSKVLEDLGQLAVQFDSHGRTLVQAVDMIDKSNKQTEGSVNERREMFEGLAITLDTRTGDLEERLRRFSELLDRSLESAEGRARDIARVIADSSVGGVQTIAQQFEAVRSASEEERRRTSEAMRNIYEQATGDTHTLLRQTTERFAEVLLGMKQMANDMQNELDATRTELRRGILELPQETAESAAQMRRVIVEQIEALAELNRIVVRHGRGLDSEPMRRPMREEPLALATVGGRPVGSRGLSRSDLIGSPPSQSMPSRGEMLGAPPPRRTEVPALTPVQPSSRGGGWLSDLLHRASRDDGCRVAMTGIRAKMRAGTSVRRVTPLSRSTLSRSISRG
ncbi:MAG: hypothetical protein HY659_07435 [Rhizobiales bacterium]|nr:hypothetical protein [Hyphomicrobiales bacterium]